MSDGIGKMVKQMVEEKKHDICGLRGCLGD
jgi:hypothetical protein